MGAEVAFRLVHAQYDRETQRAYVELRDTDDDGGEILTVAVFSFRTTARLPRRQIEEEIVRKARHLFKRPRSVWTRPSATVSGQRGP